ncbi:MAG TPA: ABC transporter substrate-binding protein [Candidatus Binatia bacterium]|jgi:ABC-type nitrate/sulfonate/bicarbonate transport system substrate-binding protein|nr:ABC transporter substrate-binding protein [Candidatus Binatia bacterium]
MKKLRQAFLIAPIYLLSVLYSTAHCKNIVIATSSVVLTNTPIWVGIERKFFDDSGLRVEYVVMRSDLAVKGLITGDVDYMQSSSSVLRAAVAGAPLTTILGVYNRTFFDLVARPEIKSLNDLRGKPIGISRYGASTEYAVRFALKANGIDPDKDVKLLAIGSGTDAARISALEAGVVAAAVLQVPSNLVAHKLGQKTILPLGDYMETLFAGLGTSQKKLQTNREEAKHVVRAVVKSMDYMARYPVETKAIIQKNLRGIESSAVEYIYDLVVKHATRNGVPSKKAVENSLLGSQFEGKPINFDKLVDFSLAREVVP